MNLDEYRSKRRFRQTPEPPAEEKENAKQRRGQSKQAAAPRQRFVIHKHDATRLHFDLRLEHAGVLWSWAVPRGPSLDPRQRRLAVQTEDHPIEYLNFEGLIPAGNYGAGPMIVWDRGHWSCDTSPTQAMRDGKIKLSLDGERLQGRWTLVRTGGSDSRNWLLIKEKDGPPATASRAKQPPAIASKDEPVVSEQTSIASGRTLAQIRTGAPAAKTASRRKSVSTLAGLPEFKPKLPTLVDRPPSGAGWLHELKLDGYRMQVRVAGGQVQLITRNGHDWTDRFPELADAIASLPLENAILDGELVALAADGSTDFSALQAALAQGQTSRLVFFFFDLLHLNDEPLAGRVLLERKRQLEPLIRDADHARLQYLDHIEGPPAPLWEACRRRGLEGVVSKRIDQPYRGGRAKDWLKSKHRRRDRFVIGGFQRSSNAVAGLGSIAVGYFDTNGNLIHCGHVGSGWSDALGQSLLATLEKHRRETCPFEPSLTTPLTWVEPTTVVEVAFAGVSSDGKLRQASLIAVESQLPADSVVRDVVSVDIAEGDLLVDDSATASKPRAATAAHTSHAPASAGLQQQLAELLQRVKVTHPERVLFPDLGATKLDLIVYLLQVNQWLLPHIQDRTVSLVRAPDGVGGETFFQRHPGPFQRQSGSSQAIEAVHVEESSQPLLRIRSLEGLVSAAQMNVIEIHPWGSRVDRMDRPDRLVLDLDPDTAVAWPQVVDAAWILRDRLRDGGLQAFVKTTGGKGLHLVIPIARRYSWDRVAQWCTEWVEKLVAEDPKRFTGTSSKRARQGKIFIDHLRNRRGATSVAPYCVRVRPGATVSVPVFWEELSASLRPDHWNIRTVPERLRQLEDDPWAELPGLSQSLK